MYNLSLKENGFDLTVKNVTAFVRFGIFFSKFDYSNTILLRPWYGQMFMYSEYLENTVNVFDSAVVKEFLVEFFKDSCCGIDKNDYVTIMVCLNKNYKKKV